MGVRLVFPHSCSQAVRLLRQRGESFPDILAAAIHTQFPGLFSDDALVPKVSTSFLKRSQIIVEMALVQ